MAEILSHPPPDTSFSEPEEDDDEAEISSDHETQRTKSECWCVYLRKQ
jgi:hypothetical protein